MKKLEKKLKLKKTVIADMKQYDIKGGVPILSVPCSGVICIITITKEVDVPSFGECITFGDDNTTCGIG